LYKFCDVDVFSIWSRSDSADELPDFSKRTKESEDILQFVP